MTYYIEWQNEQNFPLNTERMRTAAESVLVKHSVQDGSALTIVITSDDTVQQLNLRHRSIDAPTDVLSFPADAPPIEIPDEPPYLGDLVIAYYYTLAQAERQQLNVDDSFALLVIHGTLHLLGFDHDTGANKSEMWAAQQAILHILGISSDIVPASEGEI